MATELMAWLIAVPLLGVTTGLRSMTPMMLACWFAYTGYLPVEDTWAEWTSHLWVAIVFTVLAVAELVADKTPRIPDRTSLGPLLWRLVLGGMVGSIAAIALTGAAIEGVMLGLIGAILGTFGGFMVRRELVQRIGFKDWQVALAEDFIAIAAAGFALHVVTN